MDSGWIRGGQPFRFGPSTPVAAVPPGAPVKGVRRGDDLRSRYGDFASGYVFPVEGSGIVTTLGEIDFAEMSPDDGAGSMMTLVGRDAELASAVRSLLGGRGVVIAGASGVGKTALAGAIADQLSPPSASRPAAGRDVPARAVRQATVWIRATEASRQIPFGALGALLPAQMSTLHPALVPEFVAGRLRERGGGRLPLLVVDDAQLLDDSSAATVLALVTGAGARVLATVRTSGPASDAVTTLWKDDLVDRLDLAPLDRTGTRSLLEQRLGGEVTSATVELLWERSQGNALYLSELVRFGTETARLAEESGVWWWRGGTDVPPRLGELLQRRLDELSVAGRDALDVLALSAPLPYDTLAAVVAPEAILEIEERAIVSSDERDGVVLLRFAHPLLHSVAERRLTPARRRALAARLRLAPAEHVDVVRRAAWEEAAAGDPNVELLLAAADSLMLSDPRSSARFAERALRHDATPRAAIALSAAQAEVGDPTRARATLQEAADWIRTDREWLLAGLESISLALWSERSPTGALAGLAEMRAAGRPGFTDEFDTVEALVTLFGAQTGRALQLAEAALERGPAPNALVRALTVRLGALTLTERSEDTMDTVERLLAALDATKVAATRSGLAHALIALARLFHGQGFALPAMVGASGRWPTGPQPASPALVEPSAAWPLLVGVRHQLEGNWPAAAVALREAFVQQNSGEGLFRSEAVACLIVVLAEAGRTDEAAGLLASSPPDDVALIPGLRLWAEAAVAGAGRPTSSAGALALRAAEQAAQAQATPTALWYLADAARFGPPGPAVRALSAMGNDWRTPLAQARAAGIKARFSGRPPQLVDAAERHAVLGLFGHAAELAELAASRSSSSRRGEGGQSPGARAANVLRRAEARLGQPLNARSMLTDRELEIARLAAGGMSDRLIAETLVVSVRTIESHLGAAYRKLGIDNRRALAEALPADRALRPTT